ncbi:unnamed protein product [Polarella glacialis]|uniref:EF-hand domain-containing protein n=1 Tax=Polarella glacialis TaxID=89957 RepID=A0A813DN18_POLGL|nr:unnamed protein product [Polarella glacialis]
MSSKRRKVFEIDPEDTVGVQHGSQSLRVLGSGYFSDFVARHLIHKQRSAEDVKQYLSPESQRWLLTQGAASSSYSSVEAINREQLISVLQDVVTKFCKEQNDPAWQSPSDLFARKAREVWKIQHQARRLRDEVSMFFLRHSGLKILRLHKQLTNKEGAKDRLQRLDEFWPQFRSGPRIAEQLPAPLPLPPHTQPPEMRQIGRASISGRPLSAQSNSSRRPLSASGSLQGTARSTTQLDPPPQPAPKRAAASSCGAGAGRMEWKTRQSRSSCSFGTWDARSAVRASSAAGKSTRSKHRESSAEQDDTNTQVARPDGVLARLYQSVEHLDDSMLPTVPYGCDISHSAGKQAQLRHVMVRRPICADESFHESSAHSPSFRERSMSKPRRSSVVALGVTLQASGGGPPKSKQSTLSWAELGFGAGGGLRSKARNFAEDLALQTLLPDDFSASSELQNLTLGASKPRDSPFFGSDFEVPDTQGFEAELTIKVSALPGRGTVSADTGSLPEARVAALGNPPMTVSALRAVQGCAASIYLQACTRSGLLPKPTAFNTGHSNCIQGQEKGLTDADLHALRSVAETISIDAVNLEGNMKLSDQALADFVGALSRPPAASSLINFNLRGCLRAGPQTSTALLRMLADPDGARKLQHLNLGGINLGKQVLHCCRAAREHPHLQLLNLEDTNMAGQGSATVVQCITELLSSKSLRSLFLSWNMFSSEAFAHLGKLTQSSGIQSLSMVGCSLVDSSKSPVAHFLENLSKDSSLTYLDLSLNHINSNCALVLEDALSDNTLLTDLLLVQNPIGESGMRSLLRLLTRQESALARLHFEGCTGEAPGGETVLRAFSASNPGGHYVLDLGTVHHRSMLRMLYKTCSRWQASHSEAFSDLTFAPPPYKHPLQDASGVYRVPTSGRLETTFTVEQSFHRALVEVGDSEFGEYLDRHHTLARLEPGLQKVTPLLAAWKSVEGMATEQMLFLDALSKDFRMPYYVIQQFCRTRSLICDIITRLLPAIMGGAVPRFLTMALPYNLFDALTITDSIRSLVAFNAENPTGYYRLELDNPIDHYVAEQLVLLDCWETASRLRRKQADNSQLGNQSQVRNLKFCDKPLLVPRIAAWLMPAAGRLELDYSSAKRPPAGAQVIGDQSFSHMLVAVQDPISPAVNAAEGGEETNEEREKRNVKLPRDEVQALRAISHQIYLNSLQMRMMMGSFSEQRKRADCFVCWFNRTTDMHNEKVFRVRFESDYEVDLLRKRLGSLVYFPFIQPEQARFSLNFATYDERLTANLLINLAVKKERESNIRKPTYQMPDGSFDPLTMGVPRSWEIFSHMPQEGIFSFTYVCAPEDRNFKARMNLLGTYTYWTADVKEDEVLWWCSLSEAPPDVLEFLEFMLARFSDIYGPYEIMDSCNPQRPNTITLREFEDGVKKITSQRYLGHEGANVLLGIFRYLDPSGEGQVSRGEWGVLEQFCTETELSIREFVKFCERAFGEDLSIAWEAFDEDGGHQIEDKEWSAVVHRTGYFGPTMPIFRFLDKDKMGTISFEEFEELQQFQTEVPPDMQRIERGVRDVVARISTLHELPVASARLTAPFRRVDRPAPVSAAVTTANASGSRVISSVEKVLAPRGGSQLEASLFKAPYFKKQAREMICDLKLHASASPWGIAELLQRTLLTDAEGSGLAASIRGCSCIMAAVGAGPRWPLPRVMASLQTAVPYADISVKHIEGLTEVAAKCTEAYQPVFAILGTQEGPYLEELWAQPSLVYAGGRLIPVEKQDRLGLASDLVWHGAQKLSDLKCDAGVAWLQLKQKLAPGSVWAAAKFKGVDLSSSTRTWRSGPSDLIPNGNHYDPGLRRKDSVSREATLDTRTYEKEPPVHRVLVCKLGIAFDSLQELLLGLRAALSSLDVVWVDNRFRDPRCFGYRCLRLGIRQHVQDPRYSSRVCIRSHISELVLHHRELLAVKQGELIASQLQELRAIFGSCGVSAPPDLDSAQQALGEAFDCTQGQLLRRSAYELEHVLAFLARNAKSLAQPELRPAFARLLAAVAGAVVLGGGVKQPTSGGGGGGGGGGITAELQRIIASAGQGELLALELKAPGGGYQPAMFGVLGSLQATGGHKRKAPETHPVVRITGTTSRFRVEQLEFHFRNNLVKAYFGSPNNNTDKNNNNNNMLNKGMKQEGQEESSIPGAVGTSVSFGLEAGDFLHSVAQGPVGTSGSLGSRLTFGTAQGQSFTISGKAQGSEVPTRVQLEAMPGLQIVGLCLEFGRLVGLETALAPYLLKAGLCDTGQSQSQSVSLSSRGDRSLSRKASIQTLSRKASVEQRKTSITESRKASIDNGQT